MWPFKRIKNLENKKDYLTIEVMDLRSQLSFKIEEHEKTKHKSGKR